MCLGLVLFYYYHIIVPVPTLSDEHTCYHIQWSDWVRSVILELRNRENQAWFEKINAEILYIQQNDKVSVKGCSQNR